MYPQRLSTRAEITKSERALHKRLSDALDDDWTVIHASGLLISDSKDGARMREADFVIAHPERGILCLEVKGGGIEHQHGEWFRRNPGGTRERIEDPFEQVADERSRWGAYSRSRPAERRQRGGWLTAWPFPTSPSGSSRWHPMRPARSCWIATT